MGGSAMDGLIENFAEAEAAASSPPRRPQIVIVGAGFGGLTAATRLKRVDADVTVIDRRNHHLFQPLLYQVATAALSPADIAAPIRGILARQANAHVVLGEVTGIDVAGRPRSGWPVLSPNWPRPRSPATSGASTRPPPGSCWSRPARACCRAFRRICRRWR